MNLTAERIWGRRRRSRDDADPFERCAAEQRPENPRAATRQLHPKWLNESDHLKVSRRSITTRPSATPVGPDGSESSPSEAVKRTSTGEWPGRARCEGL